MFAGMIKIIDFLVLLGFLWVKSFDVLNLSRKNKTYKHQTLLPYETQKFILFQALSVLAVKFLTAKAQRREENTE